MTARLYVKPERSGVAHDEVRVLGRSVAHPGCAEVGPRRDVVLAVELDVDAAGRERRFGRAVVGPSGQCQHGADAEHSAQRQYRAHDRGCTHASFPPVMMRRRQPPGRSPHSSLTQRESRRRLLPLTDRYSSPRRGGEHRRRLRRRRSRLLWDGGRRPLPPIPARDVRRADRAVAGDRSAAHRAAHRPGQPRLPVQRSARLRQDHLGAHPGPLPELRKGPDRRAVRRVPELHRARRATAAARSMSSRSTRRATTASTTHATCASGRSTPRARPLQDLHPRRGAHGHLGGVQRAAQDRRGAARAREVHLRDHRAREGDRHDPVAHPPLPVPPRPARPAARLRAAALRERGRHGRAGRALARRPGRRRLGARHALAARPAHRRVRGHARSPTSARSRCWATRTARCSTRWWMRWVRGMRPPRSPRSTASCRPARTRAGSSKTCSSGCATSSWSRRPRTRRRPSCAACRRTSSSGWRRKLRPSGRPSCPGPRT